MRLSVDDTIFEIGREQFRLRPTLRAAYRLEKQWGLSRLVDDLKAGCVRAIVAIIREAAPDSDFARFIGEWDDVPLGFRLHQNGPLYGPLIGYLVTLSGYDHEEPATGEAQDDAEPMPLADYYERLFRIATGWLGWTPHDAWEATPGEIVEAYKGRNEMLRAIFGGSDDKQAKLAKTPQEARQKFASVMQRMLKRSEGEAA